MKRKLKHPVISVLIGIGFILIAFLYVYHDIPWTL